MRQEMPVGDRMMLQDIGEKLLNPHHIWGALGHPAAGGPSQSW
jgi:hypothetical protein